MPNCPYCTTEIIDEINFCVECENQVKCIKCGALLYKNKTRCLQCGEMLKDASIAQSRMNTYSLEEKVTKSSSYRRIEVQASDTAVDALTAKLPFGLNVPLRPLNIQEVGAENNQLALIDNSPKTITVEPINNTNLGERQEKSGSDFLNANHLFTENSDHGIIPSKTLRDYIQKLPSKKEKQQVFSIMFVWGHKERYGNSVSHESLTAAMKHENLSDGNSSKHLSEVVKNYFKVVDNHYEVSSYDGEQRVREIIKCIQNPDQTQGSIESKKSNKAGRLSGQASKAELEAVKPWLELNPEILRGFDVRKLQSASDWGIFGLYILTKILKVKETIDAGQVYAFLLKKYSTISVKRKTFVDTMRTNKKVSLSANGAYSLTEIAEKEMKRLIEGPSNT